MNNATETASKSIITKGAAIYLNELCSNSTAEHMVHVTSEMLSQMAARFGDVAANRLMAGILCMVEVELRKAEVAPSPTKVGAYVSAVAASVA